MGLGVSCVLCDVQQRPWPLATDAGNISPELPPKMPLDLTKCPLRDGTAVVEKHWGQCDWGWAGVVVTGRPQEGSTGSF